MIEWVETIEGSESIIYRHKAAVTLGILTVWLSDPVLALNILKFRVLHISNVV